MYILIIHFSRRITAISAIVLAARVLLEFLSLTLGRRAPRGELFHGFRELLAQLCCFRIFQWSEWLTLWLRSIGGFGEFWGSRITVPVEMTGFVFLVPQLLISSKS